MKVVSKAILVNTFMRMTWKKAMYFKKGEEKEPPRNSVKMFIETEFFLEWNKQAACSVQEFQFKLCM